MSAGFGISVFVIVHVTFAAGATITVAETDPAVPVVPLVQVQAPTLYPVSRSLGDRDGLPGRDRHGRARRGGSPVDREREVPGPR